MILAALSLSIAVSLLSVFLIRNFGPGGELEKQKRMHERISPSAASSGSSGLSSNVLLRKRDNLSDLEVLKKILSHYAPSKKIALILRTLKMKISVSAFLLACVVIFVLCFLGFKTSVHPALALILAGAAATLPLFYLKFMMSRYIKKFSEFLPNALSIISGSIKVGHGLESAIESAAKTAPYPVNDEFQTVIAEMKLGLSLTDALKNLQNRIQSEEFKIFLTGISVNQDLGGNLSELLDNLEKTIRERFALLREINTLSAQGKFSAWVLLAIPFSLVGLYLWKMPDIFMEFVRAPMGVATIIVCCILQVIGFFGVRQVVKLKD